MKGGPIEHEIQLQLIDVGGKFILRILDLNAKGLEPVDLKISPFEQ
jgi:hypothetical protein